MVVLAGGWAVLAGAGAVVAVSVVAVSATEETGAASAVVVELVASLLPLQPATTNPAITMALKNIVIVDVCRFAHDDSPGLCAENSYWRYRAYDFKNLAVA